MNDYKETQKKSRLAAKTIKIYKFDNECYKCHARGVPFKRIAKNVMACFDHAGGR